MPTESLTSLSDFSFAFLSILVEGAPFILLGTLISGFIDAYLPSGLIDRWLPKNRGLAVICSALLGAIFPVCECAIVPVIRRLIKKGLPVSCAITYMLSAPIINPIVVISTMSAFNSTANQFAIRKSAQIEEQGALFMTSSRLCIAFIVTVGIGLIVLKLRPQSLLKRHILPQSNGKETANESGDHGHHHEPSASGQDRLVTAMRTTMRDFIETGMYFTIGIGITAVFRAYVTEDLILLFTHSEITGIGLMMVLAFVLSLCSTSDAFIAANFPVTASAKLAFLVFGPMMDVKLVFMYLTVLRPKFVLALAIGLLIAIGSLSYLWINL